jgi:hypothetical protein
VETKGYPASPVDDHALRAELERLQAELARERVMREVLERQLDEKLGVASTRPRAPKPDRPSFLPWIAAVLLGMGVGALGYHLLGIPLRVVSEPPVGTPLQTIAPKPGS